MMKRKERINRARLHKLARLGIGLAAVTVLGGVASPIGDDLFSNSSVVYAQQTEAVIRITNYDDANNVILGNYEKVLSPGEVVVLTPPSIPGYTYVGDNYSFEISYDDLVNTYGGHTLTVNHYVKDETPKQPEQQSLPYTVEWYLDGQYYRGYTMNIEPGELHDRGVADKGSIPIWSDFADVAENSPGNYKITYEKVAAGENYYRFDLVSKDKATVPYTIELVDQDGQVLQTIQQSGVEGTEVTFDFPVISGYRIGKTEGFESGTVGKNGSFRLVANKTVKVYYDKAPSIDSLIRPEQRVEYQNVFDAFHRTVLKAFEVYKKELGVDDITYEANDLEKIFADSNLSVLHSELVLVKPLFDKPVGLVLTDQDIINAVGWTPEYWDYQIAYHKEITQKLEEALANIAASKATTTDPVDQPITIKAVYTEEQIEPGQKVDVLKEIKYTLKPGESVVLEPLTFEGWASRVVQESQTVTYEGAKARPNKEYYFYYIEEGITPTDKPVTPPNETPSVESPVTPPADSKTTETNSVTNQLAQNQPAQAGNLSSQDDKKPVSQPTQESPLAQPQAKQASVKPQQETAQQAKSLPATGEAGSILGLAGLGFTGLSGIHYALRPRKRERSTRK
ncbi:hypothetical protein ACTGXY_05215 [Streptococcus suis]